MRVLLVVAILCITAEPIAAQVFAGDSLRLRTARESAWSYGRLMGQDGSSFMLRSGADTVRLAINDLQRVDRWKRNSPGWILAIASVGLVAGGLGYNAQTPTDQRKPGEYWTYALGGAAGGAAIGFIAFSAAPGTWKPVFDR